MAIWKVKGSLERALDKSLQDLVRGIRNHQDDQAKYIAECMEEVKQELKVDNMAVKANAINKLIYLQMFGYNITWAAFNIIEVMSSPKFAHKRIGYLAASQCFHEGTDVLLLSTNLIRKELNSPNIYEAGVAMSGLSCFMTTDLARDLANDILTLMSSTKPYLRKKAVLLMYKVYLKFPDALRPSFAKLKEKLEDPDFGVQAAAVNVICELARKNPQNYLSLAPILFKLLTTSSNNWVLIKIIKLFGSMTPLEPRLGKKLIEPLTNLILSTSAMSLLYECITTIIAVLISISSGIPNHTASIQLCVERLRALIEDTDQNLKYLGLLAMGNILKTHPKSVQAHKDLILKCLDDKDESIRLRALNLLHGMISRKNLMEIVKRLLIHMDKAEGSHYRDELLLKIIEICSQDNYQYITNFQWYVSVLIELTRIESAKNGQLIASQLLDVAIRVQAVRPFCVQQMAEQLENCQVILSRSKGNGMHEFMYAAAWLCGEFADHLTQPEKTLDCMLMPSVLSLPTTIQSIFVQNILKLYVHIVQLREKEVHERTEDAEPDDEAVKELSTNLLQLTDHVMDKLAMFVHSADFEVQERAVTIHQLLRYARKLMVKSVGADGIKTLALELGPLFTGELNPVTSKAQRKVKVPEGLDLDAWINEPLKFSSEEESVNNDVEEGEDALQIIREKKPHRRGRKSRKEKRSSLLGDPSLGIFGQAITPAVSVASDLTPEELESIRQSRLREQEMNPHYLKSKTPTNGNKSTFHDEASSLTSPVHDESEKASDTSGGAWRMSDMYLKEHQQKMREAMKKKQKDKKKKSSTKSGRKQPSQEELDDYDFSPPAVVSKQYDMPEDAELSDEANSVKPRKQGANDPHNRLNINLDAPLTEGERLVSPKHHKAVTPGLALEKPSHSLPATKKTKKLKKTGKTESGDDGTKAETKTKRKRIKKSSDNTTTPVIGAMSAIIEDGDSKQGNQDEHELADVTTEEAAPSQPTQDSIPNIDDLAFWLGTGNSSQPHPNTETASTENMPTAKASTTSPSIQANKAFSKLRTPPPSCTTSEFMKKLSSGHNLAKHDTKLKSSSLIFTIEDESSFRRLVKRICQNAPLTVVDSGAGCVNLYGETLHGQCVLLLIKKLKTGHLSIEGKSDDEKAISKIVKAIRKLVKLPDA